MLSVYDIMLLKESNNNESIIHLNYGKHDFVFRILSPKEYAQVKIMTSTKEELNDAICQLTLLHPADFDFSESPVAGISDNAAKHIVEKSLIFNDIGVIESFEKSKERLTKFLPQCMLFIKAAFPEYTMSEIEEWNYEKLMDMTAKAEFVLKIKGSNYEINYDKESLSEVAEPKSDREITEEGLDPMFYNADKIVLKQPFINYPVIAGNSWDNEEMMNSVREQILRRQNRK